MRQRRRRPQRQARARCTSRVAPSKNIMPPAATAKSRYRSPLFRGLRAVFDHVGRLAVAGRGHVLFPAHNRAKPQLRAPRVARRDRAPDRRSTRWDQLAARGAGQAGHAPVVARGGNHAPRDRTSITTSSTTPTMDPLTLPRESMRGSHRDVRTASTAAARSVPVPRTTSRTMPLRSMMTVCGIADTP